MHHKDIKAQIRKQLKTQFPMITKFSWIDKTRSAYRQLKH
ncbi:hypothetical protein DSCO28_71010 [Desulfosarcina ovata subsp. sediminis]|uniref:Uncharacterized protein n=1 Tax=Desulfosarcina ovata subsp. sediminis TaxID=885957 RepID=A0A5K8A1R7_9BACT|nr:hypothetical protein DSCO28_71010 [Desulfosarcina ovata subsp. sediminis]